MNFHASRTWSKNSRAWVFTRWWSSSTIGMSPLFINSSPLLRLTWRTSVWHGWLAGKASSLHFRTLLLSLVSTMHKWRLGNLWVTFQQCKGRSPMSFIQQHQHGASKHLKRYPSLIFSMLRHTIMPKWKTPMLFAFPTMRWSELFCSGTSWTWLSGWLLGW